LVVVKKNICSQSQYRTVRGFWNRFYVLFQSAYVQHFGGGLSNEADVAESVGKVLDWVVS